MKILFLDIETAPHKGYFWKLFKENIGVSQIIEPSYTLCWAAKWYGKSGMQFASIRGGAKPKPMLQKIADLLDEADVIVHFYGKRFDIPTLNKEFIKHGVKMPSPYKQIDLKEIAAKVFYFASNKLEFVAKFLGVGCKIKTDFDLWKGVMDGDNKSWNLMERYNKQDTLLLEKLYKKMLPWIPSHPNWSSYEGGQVCPQCGSKHFISRGYYVANINKYHKYECKSCGKYFRGNKNVNKTKNEKFHTI
jgi:DNA polymerase elongation subunit (family B)